MVFKMKKMLELQIFLQIIDMVSNYWLIKKVV